MSSKKQRDVRLRRRRHQSETNRNRRTDPVPAIITDLRALQREGRRVIAAKHATNLTGFKSAIRVSIDTSDIEAVQRGFAIKPVETVHIVASETYPDAPPTVFVEPDQRFIGYPHVIYGSVLCIYLDPNREWNPTYGMEQVVDRLWQWFDNAAHDRFDQRTSLFHAVGGASPVTMPSPTVVVRDASPPDIKPLSRASLRRRSPRRLDVSWQDTMAGSDSVRATIARVPTYLPFGLANNLAALGSQIEAAGGAAATTIVDTVYGAIQTGRRGNPAHLGLIVEHPTAPDMPAIVFGMVPAAVADDLRTPGNKRTPSETPTEWIPVSDERPLVTTLRDAARPSAAFRGQSVELWGCGGLGSWIGEFITRSHPAKIVLRDPARIHGGHLIRQNYTEADVGYPKVTQLAERLRAISDTTIVEVGKDSVLEVLSGGSLPACDVIVDATINETVAHRLDLVSAENADGPLLCQVSIDRRSATLGLIVTADRVHRVGPARIDRKLAARALADASLETFHEFWQEASVGAELVPAPGCSVPTYHGSSADLAAIAGSMVSLIGQQITSPVAGIHLIASPHSGCGPPLTFIAYAGGQG
jgi:Prokaryotic E2 family A/ThiF family